MRVRRYSGVGIPLAFLWGLTIGIWSVSVNQSRAGVEPVATTNAYDGHWWLSAGIREQFGFLNGFRDCYLYEFKGLIRYSVDRTYEWQRQITVFFQNTPGERNMPAAEFVLRSRVDADQKSGLEGGEKQDHGRYDGEYWNQEYAMGGLSEQRGFIAGYLWAHRQLCRNKGGHFGRAPEEYVKLITSWYGSEPRRRLEKIAGVLFRFRDSKSKDRGD